jgi:hypothetical protein
MSALTMAGLERALERVRTGECGRLERRGAEAHSINAGLLVPVARGLFAVYEKTRKFN